MKTAVFKLDKPILMNGRVIEELIVAADAAKSYGPTHRKRITVQEHAAIEERQAKAGKPFKQGERRAA